MCDNSDNYPKRDNIYEKFLQRLKRENGLIKCKKCEINSGFVLLQRKDVFCRQCLYDYCSHKFRSTIGKSKAIHSGDRVLVAFSGGINSMAMIDMIMDGLNEVQHKKLRFIPSIVYIDESIIREESVEQKESILKNITNLMAKTGWNGFLSSIEMSYRTNDSNYYQNISDSSLQNLTQSDCQKNFMESFSSIKSLTSKQEFLKRMRHLLITDIAKNEKFDKIFFGNNASNISINMLSDISIGKGVQLSSESAFIDDRNEIPILRPLREFIAKEITFYAIMRKLEFVITKTLVTNTGLKSSIQRMTETFVNGLQTDFPSTVYTIFKTSNKLEPFGDNESKECIICRSSVDTSQPPKCSAFEALRLTQSLSNNSNSESNPGVNCGSNDLCYSCHIIANEMNRSSDDKFPKFLYKRIDRKDFNEFLIEQNEDSI